MAPPLVTEHYFETSMMSQHGVCVLLSSSSRSLCDKLSVSECVCVFSFCLQQLCKHTLPAGPCTRHAHATQPGPDVHR